MPDATPLPPTARIRRPPPRSPEEARRRLEEREAWLREIAPSSLFHALFDALPGLYFFAKNRRGELMFMSRSNRERYGLRDDSELVGRTDFDLNPLGMAQGYVRDDESIYATGEPIIDRVELWFDDQGMPAWYAVTKLPIRSRNGTIIGVMGVSQEFEGRARLAAPWPEIEAAVKHVQENFRDPVSVADLARLTCLSTRQLERKFRAVLGITPKEFLIKTRVLAACRALRESDAPLTDIAVDCGFYDQSSFTEHFHRHVGQTPGQFRRAAARHVD
jgi:AraC-like DNA-binding protein